MCVYMPGNSKRVPDSVISLEEDAIVKAITSVYSLSKNSAQPCAERLKQNWAVVTIGNRILGVSNQIERKKHNNLIHLLRSHR